MGQMWKIFSIDLYSKTGLSIQSNSALYDGRFAEYEGFELVCILRPYRNR